MGEQMGQDQVLKTNAASVPCHRNGLGIAVMRFVGRDEPLPDFCNSCKRSKHRLGAPMTAAAKTCGFYHRLYLNRNGTLRQFQPGPEVHVDDDGGDFGNRNLIKV